MMKRITKRKLIWCLLVAIMLLACWGILKFLAAATIIVNAIVLTIFASIGFANVVYYIFSIADRLVNKICGKNNNKKTVIKKCSNCLYNLRTSRQPICSICNNYDKYEPVEDE